MLLIGFLTYFSILYKKKILKYLTYSFLYTVGLTGGASIL